MALPIDVAPYELIGVVTGDSYLTHYKAKDDKNDDYIITEFYPTYMVQRGEDDSRLDVSERFAKEFVKEREEFIRRVTAFEELEDHSIHPAIEVFERNNTAYLVRKACVLTPVETYMGGQQMDYLEAYQFIKPLLMGMAQAAESGILFSFGLQDLRVNSYRQLVLSGVPVWDTDFHPSLIEVVRLYYRLVTGVEAASEGAPGFSVFGIDVPQRLEGLVMEVLTGDILYGSLDDFYRKFKSIIDGSSETDGGSDIRTVKVLKIVAAVLLVVAVFSTSGLVFGAVQAYRSNFTWANPELFASSDMPELNGNNFTQVAVTHPTNVGDTLNGSFNTHDGFMFLRGQCGMVRRRIDDTVFIPGAAGLAVAGDETLIIEGVSPSFIVGYGRYIYFVDSLAGNFIYRALFNGQELERITEHPALYLAAVGGFLYYTSPTQGYHLYRINLATLESQLYLPMPAFSTIVYGSRLYFVSGVGTEYSGLYVVDTETGESEGIIGGVGFGIRTWNGRVFYKDMWGQVRSIDMLHRPITTHAPRNVLTFDVFAQWIIFTEEGRHVPRAYNLNTGVSYTLTATEWVSYLWADDGSVYGIDHRNPQVVHQFSLPQ